MSSEHSVLIFEAVFDSRWQIGSASESGVVSESLNERMLSFRVVHVSQMGSFRRTSVEKGQRRDR